MSKEIQPLLVEHLLREGGIVLPLSLMKQRCILEIEQALRKERPLAMKECFENFYRRFG